MNVWIWSDVAQMCRYLVGLSSSRASHVTGTWVMYIWSLHKQKTWIELRLFKSLEIPIRMEKIQWKRCFAIIILFDLMNAWKNTTFPTPTTGLERQSAAYRSSHPVFQVQA